MRYVLRRIWCLVLSGAFALFSSTTCAALPASELDFYAQNNFLFYDPTASQNCSSLSYAVSTTTPANVAITWIGDSYSVGAQSDIESVFTNVDFGSNPGTNQSNIQVSKRFAYGDDSNPSGLTILDRIISEGNLREVLVFALGTNDPGTDEQIFSGWIDDVMSVVQPSTKVVFVTNYTDSGANYSGNNSAMKAAVDRYPNQVFVADWAGIAQPGYYDNDPSRIHPFGHYGEWVNIIKGNVPGVSSGMGGGDSVGGLAGDDNKAKIWNYITATYSQYGYNFTPEIIAGILGNIKLESEFNPFAANSLGMRGLYQTNNASFKRYVEDAVGGDYWGRTASADIVEKAIRAEIDYLMDRSLGYNWNRNSESQDFVNLLDLPYYKTGEDGAAAYADLFLVTVEKATDSSGYSHDEIWDPNVKEAVITKRWAANSEHLYQAANARRKNARDIYNEYVGNGGAVNLNYSSEANDCDISTRPYTGSFPQYFQGDPRWSSDTFGYIDGCHSDIGTAGCGPTSFAMMATALLGREILPSDVVAQVPDQYACDQGSSWTITQRLAEIYGLEYERVPVSSDSAVSIINQYLNEGWMFHVSGIGSAPFSTGGHYIGIYGIDDNGDWLIADSSARGNSVYSPNTVITAGMALSNINAIRNPNYIPGGSGDGDGASSTIGGDDTADCYPGTIDLGLENEAYFSGQRKTIRLCSIPTITQSDSSDGNIHVNSRVSESYYKLGQLYREQTGNTLTASESFRTNARQQYFWNCYVNKNCNNGNLAGRPGYSNHQGGLAVDFNMGGGWDSAISKFFYAHLGDFGLNRQLSSEPWHVSPSGN